MRKAAERGEAQLDGHGDPMIDRTSLSVNVRKAAGRVLAQLGGDGVVGGHRRRDSDRSNVSVCEHAEGSRACVGFIFS
ncbi:hypothetical protein N7535_005606 [Penicillium sp. DV-2018c]|nr:hypothetical protein N7461_009180 [Penicillium sp. DV-2018c]KAJ5571946.1 hypothetical protein N7535_005606 [Penicillium sp. DV-2018c]